MKEMEIFTLVNSVAQKSLTKFKTCDLPKTRSVGSCSILLDQQCEHNE